MGFFGKLFGRKKKTEPVQVNRDNGAINLEPLPEERAPQEEQAMQAEDETQQSKASVAPYESDPLQPRTLEERQHVIEERRLKLAERRQKSQEQRLQRAKKNAQREQLKQQAETQRKQREERQQKLTERRKQREDRQEQEAT